MGSRKLTPTFNLSAVVRETGVKPDTLRAWERRYGLPTPERTSGGHRIYSQRDIETLKWLVARQQEGLSISRAIDFWRQTIEDGDDPLQELPLDEQSGIHLAPGLFGAQPLDELRKAWIEACLSYDEIKADQILTKAFALFPMEIVCIDVIQLALSEVGRLWYEGKATVQQEHFTSMVALRRIESLLGSMPPPFQSGAILAFCPSEEDHHFPLLLLTLLLRRRGYNVVFLGANVPIDHLDQTIEEIQPKLAITSAQTLITAANLLQAANCLAEAEIPLGYGGLVFNQNPQIRERIPGRFLGETIPQALDSIAEIHHTSRPEFDQPVISHQQHGVTNFLANIHRMRAEVDARVAELDLQESMIPNATSYFIRAIEAALVLGEPGLLEAEIHWLQGYLTNRNIPQNQLPMFLSAFLAASRAALGPDGRSLVQWLESLDFSGNRTQKR